MSGLLHFDRTDKDPEGSTAASPLTKKKNPSPYATMLYDLDKLLPPDRESFGLFSDPYARMIYIEPRMGANRGTFWFNQRMDEGNFTEKEVRLLQFLAKTKVATRNQLHHAIHPDSDNTSRTTDFLKKCKNAGIITTFSWISPLRLKEAVDRKKPMIYGLTKAGAEAVAYLTQQKLNPKLFFTPVTYTPGNEPEMKDIFTDLIAAQLYNELIKLDRLIDWKKDLRIHISSEEIFVPYVAFDVIKDNNQFVHFWLEVFRNSTNWEEKYKARFAKMQRAYNLLPEDQQPNRIIIVVDGYSRIQPLWEIAQQVMPDITVRFTTDEKLIAGIDKFTFLDYHPEQEKLVPKYIAYLLPDFSGMKATEHFKMIYTSVDDYEY